MVRFIVDKLFTYGSDREPLYYVEGFCEAADVSTLPTTGIVTGSSVVAVDSGSVYFFNEESSSWEEQ